MSAVAEVIDLDRSAEFWAWYEGFAAPRLRGRDAGFRKMFRHLDSFDRPVHIVETGCVVEPDNWAGNGCSTILFDGYARSRPGSTVRSVDISPRRIVDARGLFGGNVELECGDSADVLRRWVSGGTRPIDLLYLDASDLDWNDPVPSAHHHLSELLAAIPALSPRSMVAVDDAPVTMDELPRVQIGGKGEFVARYLFSVGADLEFLDYQAAWTNVTARPGRDQATVQQLIDRARAHVEADRLTAAEPLYRLVLSVTMPPWTSVTRVARGEALVFYAKLALSKRRYGTASDLYREALVADPAASHYRLELARGCYLPMGLLDAAASEAQRAAEVSPDDPTAWRTLGGLEHERRELRRAARAYDRGIEASPPDEPGAALDRATLALDQADYELTTRLCRRALNTERDADALHVLAMVAYREARHEEAAELFDRAIAGGCADAPAAHWHKSHALEAVGCWPEAWAERAWRAESRTNQIVALPMRRFDAPLWDGEAGPGRVHVHAEAGAGDNIAMARYLPLMAERGLEVCYEAAPELVDLVRRSFPEVEVVRRTPFYPDALGVRPFDYHCPIGHLQHAFRTSLETVPRRVPYLRADPELVERYRARLPPGRRRVGLCWSSGIRLNDSAWLAEYGRRKSMNYAALSPVVFQIADSGGVSVSLQVGPERIQCFGGVTRDDLLPDEPTWDDTAALVECLDLVITVDTAVAHLAGALGKPTWVMCQRDAQSWHFMCWRPGATWNERSPWYPTARVFRQREFNRPHHWDDVVADVTRALASG